jgi:hypothetical protein
VRRSILGVAIAVVVSSCIALPVAPSGVGVASTGPLVTSGPFIPTAGKVHADVGGVPTTTSPNWAGFVQSAGATGTFTEVTDTFIVPTAVSPTAGTQYATDWVGIGGFYLGNSSISDNLVQAGVQMRVTTTDGHSTVGYDAFTETLPHLERPFKFKVSAGDSVTVTVMEFAKNRWRMTVDDMTKQKTRSRTARYRSTGLSAEAIHERPCILIVDDGCRDPRNLAPLAQTSNVTFDPGSFSEAAPGLPPVNVPLLSSVPQAALIGLTMTDTDADMTPIAITSAPNTTDDGFTVADGASAPPPPNN